MSTFKHHKEIRKAIKNSDFSTAIDILTRVLESNPNDIDIHLQLAHCYQQAEDLDRAAKWYLKTAHLYVDMGIGIQAAALLRIYRDLQPNDMEACRDLFHRCHQQTSDPEALLDMLSDKDKTRFSMRYGDIFSALDDASFDRLLDHMKIHELQKGDVLVRMGDPAYSLFLVADGGMEVWRSEGDDRLLLGTIPAGGVCGETPLFVDQKIRIADLVAKAPSRIIEIEYALLDDIQKHNKSVAARLDKLYHQHLLERQISLNPFFQSLPLSLRKEVIDHTKVVRLLAGEVLMREGDEGIDFYLIRSGTLAIHVNVDGKERLYRIAKSGDVVGEIAITNNGVRTATAEVLTDVVLLCWKDTSYRACYEKSEGLRKIVATKLVEQEKQRKDFFQGLKNPTAKSDENKQFFFY